MKPEFILCLALAGAAVCSMEPLLADPPPASGAAIASQVDQNAPQFVEIPLSLKVDGNAIMTQMRMPVPALRMDQSPDGLLAQSSSEDHVLGAYLVAIRDRNINAIPDLCSMPSGII